MVERRVGVSVIFNNEISPNDIINTPPSTEAKRLVIRGRWQKTVAAVMNQRYKLPSQTPTPDIIQRRSERIENILLNECNENPSKTSYAYSLLGMVLGIVFTLMLTSYPQHYPIGDSKYWYEPLLNIIFTWGPLAAVNLINLCFFCMGINGMSTVKTCFTAYGFGTTTACILQVILYTSWVHGANLPFPMPFHGYITAVLTWYTMNAVFWFQCPKAWRSASLNRKKMLFCVLFLNMTYVAELTYKVVQRSFIVIPKHLHWPLIAVLVIVRELHAGGLCYLGQKAAGYHDLSIEVLATEYGALRHAIFLSVDGASITTNVIAYTILAVDFLMNVFCTLIVIWCDKNRSEKNRERQVKALLNLIINEAVEFMVPISYVITLLMAYYGPNGEILGNIKNSFWQYRAIDNLGDTLKWIAIMFSVDFASLIVSYLLLQYFCKINIFRIYLQIQDQMGHMLGIATGYMIAEVTSFSVYFRSLQLNNR